MYASRDRDRLESTVPMDAIRIRGARQHNLQNVSCDLPRNKLVVITGVSGSGKSSLAFDTIFAEGQRRYVESLSAYARQFLEQMEKPDVDSIEGLSPAISIEQRTTSQATRARPSARSPRSTTTCGSCTPRWGSRTVPSAAGRSRRRRSRRWSTALCACRSEASSWSSRPTSPARRASTEADGRDGQGGLPPRPRGREVRGSRRSARARQAEEAHDRDRRRPPRRQGRPTTRSTASAWPTRSRRRRGSRAVSSSCRWRTGPRKSSRPTTPARTAGRR